MVKPMLSVKKPAVAGAFYPGESIELKEDIKRHMEQGFKVNQIPKAIIAPHAGYIYSGDIAGSAYSPLPKLKNKIRRVVLLGPCHRVPVRTFAFSSAQYFETPLGQVPLARGEIDKLINEGFGEVHDEAFAEEHSLEVHLPFFQCYLEDYDLIPIVVGGPEIEDTSRLIERLYGDDSTLIIISSDLSHYLDYQSANDIDMVTSQQIMALDFEHLGDKQACGRYPVKGMMHLARKLGLTARAIDLRNSGDTQGNLDRVVGYGAYHFYEPDEINGFYSNEQKRILKQIAVQSILHGLQNGRVPALKMNMLPFKHEINKATFITLQQQGRLRGCIGSVEAHRPLVEDVAVNAFRAAFEDHRFQPLTEDELKETSLHISVLSAPEPIEFASEAELVSSLRKTIDGLIIADQGYRAIFLPSVWESIHEPQEFLSSLKLKAGLPKTHWSDTFKAYRFIADKF